MYKDGMSMSWENGKELSQIIKGEDTFSYKYNSQGIRIGKTVNGVEHIYTLEGSRILSESYGNITMLYIYDETNSPIGIAYRENDYAKGVFDYYLYLKNLQGDIIGICNSSYELISEYTYNAWGECTITNYTEDNIGNVNPFRYRGYYHDSETGFYYLNSRYYDPQIKRFINADDISYMDPITLTGINLYAYCDNNPVMYVDPSGHFIISLLGSILVGVAVSALSYTGSELIAFSIKGEWTWSWEQFFGSVIGGVVGGTVGELLKSFEMLSKLAGAMTSGFTSVFMGDVFEYTFDGEDFDIGSTLKRSVQAGLFSMVATGLTFKFFPKKSTIFISANWQKEIKKIYYSFAGIFKDFYNKVSDDLFYGYWDMVHSGYSKYYND